MLFHFIFFLTGLANVSAAVNAKVLTELYLFVQLHVIDVFLNLLFKLYFFLAQKTFGLFRDKSMRSFDVVWICLHVIVNDIVKCTIVKRRAPCLTYRTTEFYLSEALNVEGVIFLDWLLGSLRLLFWLFFLKTRLYWSNGLDLPLGKKFCGDLRALQCLFILVFLLLRHLFENLLSNIFDVVWLD